MVHEDYKEMIPARALSALDAAEERALNEHLENCSECRKELEEWQETAAALAVAADPAEPSPQVRERILSEVRKDLATPQLIPFRSTPRNLWSSFGSLGAIAAVAVFAVLIVGLLVIWRVNRATQANLARVSIQLKEAQEELQRSNEFLRIVTTPGARVTDLKGIDLGAGATAKVAYDKTGHAMLIARGLPTVPQGKEYQLWFIVGGKPMPGRSFAPDDAGKGALEDQMPEAALGAAIFALTVEPKGGVEAPTGPIYLRSEL
jgi:anti-sigma-K factor RskA